ncbi:MAG TPA: tetratricopeptide repeat protein [Blastocatellia bacterium]|nr:tetratricopeptide repeat protein [Blastocatellia bacterium]
MSDSSVLPATLVCRPGHWSFVLLCLIWSALLFTGAPVAAGVVWQGGFVVFGRVALPDGKPATRVRVFIETLNGLKRETLSDDQGNYEFRGLGAGRYRLSATNPEEPRQFSEPAESDTTRAFANRLQVNIYLRLPHDDKREARPGTIHVAEVAQNIPKPARKAYEQGLRLQKENQADQALAQFSQAIELYPAYFQALTERANLLMTRNRLAEAETDFGQAVQLNGKYAPALRGIGYCQIQQRKFEAAVDNLEKAVSLEPQVALSHLLLGYARLSLNQYEQAKQALQQALKLGPESAARAHVYLGEVLAHEQKFREAADELRQYLKLKPDAADAAHLKALESEWRARSKAPQKQP